MCFAYRPLCLVASQRPFAPPMLVVTGASGHLGRAILENAVRLVPAAQLVASVRDPQQATALAARGIQVRAGDFAAPASLRAAFAGATQVLVVSPNQLGEAGHRLTRTAIEAAQAVGARRVLYTSHLGAQADSSFAPAVNHAAAEAFLAETGLPFTSLRHGYYAESALFHLGRGFETGEIRAPEDGPVSWTTRADLAAADALLLAQEGRLEGLTPSLTAPEAFTLADLASIASELLGREVKRVTVTDEQWLADKAAQGVPAPLADMLLGSYRASRRGDFATVDPTLAQVLGRRPQTMREVLVGLLKPASV
jgi:NAD(P)H dehydrogenase (quinone)